MPGGFPFPTLARVVADGVAAHAGIDVIGEPVGVWEATPAGFVKHGPAAAIVSAYLASELVPGGPIEAGDWRCLINGPSFAALGIGRRLEKRDRVEWRGRQYAVVNFNDTRGAGGVVFAVELQLRG